MSSLMRRLAGRFRWPTVMLFLAVVGPGIITANVDNDAGGITTYSLAGAHFGHAFLWTLLPITLALIVVQEMSARLGVATGKGLADLIRERFGVRWACFVLGALFLANLGNTVAEFSGVAAAMEIFGISKYLSVPLAAMFVGWLVVKGNYRQLERVFLTASLFYLTYVISGIMAAPRWGPVLQATVTPSWSFHPGYLSMFLAMVGTTIAPWMQFYLQSSVADKKIRPRDYWITRWDVIIGCVITDLVAFFIVVACAETLFQHHLTIQTAQDAARALVPLAGSWAAGLFAFGLFNASVFSASILPLSTSYSICEGMGWESGIDRSFRQAPAFYLIYGALIVLGASLVLVPGAPLIALMYWSQVANGILLPFVLVFMLRLINRRRLMGELVNGPMLNAIAWTLTGVMGLTTLLLVLTTLWPGWRSPP